MHKNVLIVASITPICPRVSWNFQNSYSVVKNIFQSSPIIRVVFRDLSKNYLILSWSFLQKRLRLKAVTFCPQKAPSWMFDRALNTPLYHTGIFLQMIVFPSPLSKCIYLFRDGSSYHIEISPWIYRANQWTGFFMIGTTVMKKSKTRTRQSQ